jgi:hypothetical protein
VDVRKVIPVAGAVTGSAGLIAPDPAALRVLIDVPALRVSVRASANLAPAHSRNPSPGLIDSCTICPPREVAPVAITAGIAWPTASATTYRTRRGRS